MGDGQLLPGPECFSNVWFGILEHFVGWIFFFLSFHQKLIFCCLEPGEVAMPFAVEQPLGGVLRVWKYKCPSS